MNLESTKEQQKKERSATSLIAEHPALQEICDQAKKSVVKRLQDENKERIGALALDRNFVKERTKNLKSLYAGTPFNTSAKKLFSLADSLSKEIVTNINNLLTPQLLKEVTGSTADQEKEELLHSLTFYYRKNIISNLRQNLPHLRKTLDFNMFFNTETILTMDHLIEQVGAIQKELVEKFLHRADYLSTHEGIPALSPEIIEKIRQQKIITSSGINLALQSQENLTPTHSELYMETFASYADRALLQLIKGEHSFHKEMEYSDEILLNDLREAKNQAQAIYKEIGQRLLNISIKYAPELDTEPFLMDYDSSLDALNLYELVSLLIHSKTLDEYQTHEVQQLAFFTHLAFAIVSDPHYKAMKKDKTFHINRADPQSKRYCIKKSPEGKFYLTEDAKGQVLNKLVQRTWKSEDSTLPPVEYFNIGSREKSLLSIMIKFFARSKVQHIEDLYDLWGATFVVNTTKEQLAHNPKMKESIHKFMESIAESNLYTAPSKDTSRKDPAKGYYTIETEKAKNENSSSIFSTFGKITSKSKDGVGKEIIIQTIDEYLTSLDEKSPANHKFYEDFRFLKFALQITPSILFPERHKEILELYKRMEQVKNMAEEKHR